MPPSTQQVLDALDEMQNCPIPLGYKAVAKAAAAEIGRLKADRLKLDRRIHNQRVALRQNWEIVEARRKWLGSETARKAYVSLWKRYRELRGW